MKRIALTLAAVLLLLLLYIGSICLPSFFYKNGYTHDILHDMKIIAHRGGASLAPENTLTCYRKGIEAGADMIETDIHLTRDGHIVVCHDERVDRTTDGSGRIRDLSLDEIRRFRVVDADGHPTDEHLPTLSELFALLQEFRAHGREVGLLCEIKRSRPGIYKGLEEQLIAQIAANDARRWVIVQSFDDYALDHVHQLDSTLRLEKLLVCKLPGLPFIIDGPHLSRFSYEKYSHVSSFNFWYRGISRSLLDDIHAHGREVKLWTLEDLDAPRLAVDGIITNRPDLWVKERENCQCKGNY